MQYKKVQKSRCNEPYSSSSFTKQSCSKMALYRWIRTESRQLISKLATEFRPSFIIIIIIIIVVIISYSVHFETKMKAHNRWISRTVNLQAASQLGTCLGKVNNNNNYYYYATTILYV